ncbi:carboxypeptidase regulatory-like domain-containing protein, partial [Haloferula sp.]|uniref:carboxypeptidase regulatory-like domain-containing protein n=1 Tax=Haloferula sp. TaxID=2497595 RepID=UPI003C778CED
MATFVARRVWEYGLSRLSPMPHPFLSILFAWRLRCDSSGRRDLRLVKGVVNLLAVLAVSPALVLGPCYGEVMVSLPIGSGVSISGSLLPDRSNRREVEGQAKEDDAVSWAPVVSPWAWSDLDPAWRPLGELAGPETFLAFWETSAAVFPSQVVAPLMPVPLAVEGEAAGGAVADAAPTSEIDPALAPGDQEEEGWVPEEVDGNPAAEATVDVPAEARDPLLVEQLVGECTVMGEVSDRTTLDPIEGAIISIGGTGREDETDAQGRFRIDGLPQGVYTVEALKLGYSMGSASASPRPGVPAEIRIALTVKPSDSGDSEFILAEETVVGEYQEGSQGDFNLDLSSSLSLTSGLSAEDFAKENVSDAGEAVGKVSG